MFCYAWSTLSWTCYGCTAKFIQQKSKLVLINTILDILKLYITNYYFFNKQKCKFFFLNKLSCIHNVIIGLNFYWNKIKIS